MVPNEIHGTSCGWSNATILIDEQWVIKTEGHPGFGQNYNVWFNGLNNGNTIFSTAYIKDLKKERDDASARVKHLEGQINELSNFLFKSGIADSIGSHGGAVGEAIFQMDKMQKEITLTNRIPFEGASIMND